jgi:hypothetical protein
MEQTNCVGKTRIHWYKPSTEYCFEVEFVCHDKLDLTNSAPFNGHSI